MILTTSLNNGIIGSSSSSGGGSIYLGNEYHYIYNLETFRRIIGYNPYHFYQQANTSIPVTSECNSLVLEHSWQSNQSAGRKEIERAIESAKGKLRDYLGYRLGAEYVTREIPYPRPYDRRMQYGRSVDASGRYLSVNTGDGFVKSVGVETFADVDVSATIVYSDENGDGINDTATITIADVGTELNPGDVTCYFMDADRPDGSTGPNPEWRVYPDSITILAQVLTIKIKSWLLVRPILLDGVGQSAINPNTSASFAVTLNVQRRYTATNGVTAATSQALMIWEANPPPWATCDTSEIRTDPASVGVAIARCGIRDSRSGEMIPGEAIYDEDAGTWTGKNWDGYKQPDRVVIRYLAGANLQQRDETNIYSSDWGYIITHLAIAELSKRICGCEDANRYLDEWSEDLARISGNADQLFRISEQDLNNPFGTRRGHIYAWKRVKQLALTRSFVI